MHTVTIERNGTMFGPYDEAQLSYYIGGNRILLNDMAHIDGAAEAVTVKMAMKRCGWRMPKAKNPLSGIRQIGLGFILPWSEIRAMQWIRERRFLFLAIIGLVPLLIVLFSGGSVTYIAIAVYFSVVWGLFFYSIFPNTAVRLKMCLVCYGCTALISTTAVVLLHAFGVLAVADTLADSPLFLLRFVGMFFAAGLPEELAKAAVIFWLVRRPGHICVPQTVVLYGLFSGLGFGIEEGIMYQMDINREQGVDMAYFLNVLRLTSLPFLHAIWCGISAYFIAFSALFPMYRHSLWLLAILVPATIHALYNSLGLFSIIPALFGVLLFTIYLSNSKNMKQKLI